MLFRYGQADIMKEADKMKLKLGNFLNCKVPRFRYAIMANRWFAGWLQEEISSFVKLCGV